MQVLSLLLNNNNLPFVLDRIRWIFLSKDEDYKAVSNIIISCDMAPYVENIIGEKIIHYADINKINIIAVDRLAYSFYKKINDSYLYDRCITSHDPRERLCMFFVWFIQESYKHYSE